MRATVFTLRFLSIITVTACILGCGARALPTAAETTSTDQRPDISEDRTEVNITAGTKGNLIIKATDLKGLVRGVPDFDNNGTKTEELRGEFIFQVAQNPRTHMVAVAVRSFIYAETDFSMLFVINPATPDKPQLVKFVLPGQKPAADGSTLPFRAVRELYYDAAGILHLTHTDASGSRAKVLINPDLSIRGCSYSERGEGLLCAE